MSVWLRKQLVVLLGVSFLGGALLCHIGVLPAQEQNKDSFRDFYGIKSPRQTLTRDEAAKNFILLLGFLYDGKTQISMTRPTAKMMSSFSRKSENEILGGLLTKLADQLRQPQQKVKVQSEKDKNAVVIVETLTPPAARPLVLVKEGNSWGVDVFETYAKWNNLSGAAKIKTLARLSNEIHVKSEKVNFASCRSNLMQIALGLAQYKQDYDEKSPLPQNWIDSFQPYLRTEDIFECPSVSAAKGYGYAYNSKLSTQSGFNESKTVFAYETTVLKRNAHGNGEDRAFRHMSGANYAFADGHVKWFDKSQTPSFNLKP